MGRKFDPKPKKVTVIRYETAEGKRCKKGDPGAIKKVTISDTYYAQLPHPETGKRTWESLETTDLGAAWVTLKKKLRERALGLDGHSRKLASAAKLPLAENLEAWLVTVQAGGSTEKWVQQLRSRVLELAELANWKRVTDITRSSCQQALARLQATPTTGSTITYNGRSAQTRNHYLSHARQFTRWLRVDGRLSVDPLEGLKPVSVDADRRHDRRVPTDLEVELLFTYLLGGWSEYPPRKKKGMSGEQRALGYMVSMCTGLRAGELRSLKEENISLETGQIRLKASVAKNRKRTMQPLPAWLLERLRVWFEGGGGYWDSFPEQVPGRFLQADLEQARSAWIALGEKVSEEEKERRKKSIILLYSIPSIDGPLFWDFHALRHYYISQLASQEGISPAVLQALSRHSDPDLTLRIYTKAKTSQVQTAADQIRIPGASPPA